MKEKTNIMRFLALIYLFICNLLVRFDIPIYLKENRLKFILLITFPFALYLIVTFTKDILVNNEEKHINTMDYCVAVLLLIIGFIVFLYW